MIQEKRIKHLLKVLIRNKQKELSIIMSFMKDDDPQKERYTDAYGVLTRYKVFKCK